MAERIKQGPKNLQVAEYCQVCDIFNIHYNTWPPACRIQEDGVAKDAEPVHINRPSSWKLATAVGEEGEKEELVLRIQGIICDRNLPPIRRTEAL